MAELFVVKLAEGQNHVFLLLAEFLKLADVVENVDFAIFHVSNDLILRPFFWRAFYH